MKPAWASRAKATRTPGWVQRACAARRINGVRRAAPRTKAWKNRTNLRAKLQAAKLPAWFLTMVYKVAASMHGPLLYGVEAFSGQGQLSAAFAEHVGAWSSFEILNNNEHNLLLDSGLEILLGMVLSICAGGVLWMGTPCKSWVALSRSFTRRSLAWPEGPPVHLCTARQKDYLKEHNTLADRTAMLAELVSCLGISYVVEQPQSSILFHYRPLADVLTRTNALTIPFRMCNFRGDSPKPLRLKGTGMWLKTFLKVNAVRQKGQPKPVKRLVVQNAAGRFAGIKNMLTASSGYTRSMGTALALSYLGMGCMDVCKGLEQLGL